MTAVTPAVNRPEPDRMALPKDLRGGDWIVTWGGVAGQVLRAFFDRSSRRWLVQLQVGDLPVQAESFVSKQRVRVWNREPVE